MHPGNSTQYNMTKGFVPLNSKEMARVILASNSFNKLMLLTVSLEEDYLCVVELYNLCIT